jgi:hypothetical protein
VGGEHVETDVTIAEALSGLEVRDRDTEARQGTVEDEVAFLIEVRDELDPTLEVDRDREGAQLGIREGVVDEERLGLRWNRPGWSDQDEERHDRQGHGQKRAAHEGHPFPFR